MGAESDRSQAPWRRAAWGVPVWLLIFTLVLSWLGASGPLQAQQGDFDAPEGPNDAGFEDAPGEELIDDPELAGVPSDPEPKRAAETPLEAPAAPSGEVRVVLRTRMGVDVQWQDPREDIFEATQLALFEARVRRSERLLFGVGLRLRHVYATRQEDTPDAGAARHELDATPTAGYAELGLADPLHLRLGYQSVHLGRFDVFNAADILSSYDLRSGPTTMPEAAEIAQPAVRLDWEPSGSLLFRLLYVPFFQPHRARISQGDYALAPATGAAATQAEIDEALAMAVGPDTAPSAAELLRSTVSRSSQGRLADSSFSAFAPDPDPTHPQAALRFLWRGGAGELGLTVGTALEHLPVTELSQPRLSQLSDGLNNGAAIEGEGPLFEVRYGRFAVASLDAATDLAGFQLGAELAYMRGRTLLAGQTGLPAEPDETDVAHASLRTERIVGQSWVLTLEAFGQYALTPPDDSARRFMFMTEDRLLLGAAAFTAFAVPSAGLRMELGGGVLNGPSYLIAPRLELELVTLTEGLFVELGAYILGGKRSPDTTDPTLALGGRYSNVDQVFAGLRFLP
ncbi:MAG: hypothetical protein OEZ06_12675 [Myxococcales bacterium]|nr:hypothetical protein [Myxococcales bacterium]